LLAWVGLHRQTELARDQPVAQRERVQLRRPLRNRELCVQLVMCCPFMLRVLVSIVVRTRSLWSTVLHSEAFRADAASLHAAPDENKF
jgi:hypothetical protein